MCGGQVTLAPVVLGKTGQSGLERAHAATSLFRSTSCPGRKVVRAAAGFLRLLPPGTPVVAAQAIDQMRPVFHGPRLEMPCHEFDGGDFTSRLPGQAQPETVLAYFDSGLSQPELDGRLDEMLADMADVLRYRGRLPM